MNSRLVLSAPALTLLLVLHGDIVTQNDGSISPSVRFADPIFWEIVERGPATSAELEQVVTTYASNGMLAEVEEAFAEYIIRTDIVAHPYCAFCLSLLKSVDTENENPLAAQFIDATDMVLDDAFTREESAGLIKLAILTSMSHFHEHHDRSLYFLSAAAQIGIDDSWRDEVLQVLTTLGLYSDALAVAHHIRSDVQSEHYQSERLSQWITYLEELIERKEKVGAFIAASLAR
jgi:hypothetical protein